MNLEEKQKKLDELRRMRKKKQEESKQQPSHTEPTQNQYSYNHNHQLPNRSVQQDPTDIDNLVQQLVKQKENQKLYQESTPTKTNIISSIKRNLGFCSNIFSHNINMVVKIDAECQASLDDAPIKPNMDQLREQKSANNVPRRHSIEESDNALPQKNKDNFFKQAGQQIKAPEQAKKKEIPEEELKGIMTSIKFSDFINKQSKAIERALDGFDTTLMEDILEQDDFNNNEDLKGDLLRHQIKFKDDNYTANRIVTDLSWSSFDEKLILASYSENPLGNIDDPIGVALCWSPTLRSKPEYYCFANSPITSTCFQPYARQQIIGGLANGQIVIWDLRAKQQPVQRTQMSSEGHTHPIFSIEVIGSQKANNICSISNDGRLCVWNQQMLNAPYKVVDLKNKYERLVNDSQNDINVTCMQFPEDDPNNFYVGSEDGQAYCGQIHGNQMRSDNIMEKYTGHQGPITALSLQNQTSPVMNGLLLTASMDWSIKLWNPKQKNEVIHSFETAEDYVYDVKWNPVYPTIFGSVDGEGYVDIWDLAHDKEVPRVHFKATSNNINKLRWNKDGTKLIIGDSHGEINVYSLDKRLLKTNQDKMQEIEYMINNPQAYQTQ